MNSTIVMSMDVTALYPSISKELAVRTIIKTVKQSNIPWENVDEKQLSRYVALTSDSKLIKDSKLTKCIYKPKTKTTLNSYTNPSKRSRAVNGDNQFIEPEEPPNSKQVRSMIALAIASGVKTVMNNHYYTFGGVIRKQSEGGAIGAEMTGEVSRNVMSVWDSRFLEKTKVLGILIELYKRYVDDDLIICPPINPGWRYCVIDNTMKYSAELAMLDVCRYLVILRVRDMTLSMERS